MDLINITQIVNLFPVGTQFQNIKGFSREGRWLLQLEFYPEPRCLVMGLNRHNVKEISFLPERLKGLSGASHPLLLFLKAHVVNQRVSKVELLPDHILRLSFLPSNSSWELQLDGRGSLHNLIKIEGRKPFNSQLSLDQLPSPDLASKELAPTAPFGAPPSGLEQSTLSEPPVALPKPSAAILKKEKLLRVIEDDRKRAETWFEHFGPIIEVLKVRPMAWGEPSHFSKADVEAIAGEVAQKHLPSFIRSHSTLAKDQLFQLSRKMRRRLEGANKRLEEVKRAELSQFEKKAITVRKPSQKGTSEKAASLGLRVILSDGIVAMVGTSALENAALFKKASSRDLWFHVRAFAGAHVWIHRGQKGFGAKDEASEKLLIEGAKLALFNSKLRRGSRRGDVDITERRYLKAIKGAKPGLLSVLRSETRIVHLDEAFEKMIKAK